MLHGLGIPCPGSARPRHGSAILRGDWHTWLQMHALAPCFLLAVGLFAAAAVLPARPREVMIDAVERLERRTGISSIVLARAPRLLARPGPAIAPHAFVRLMRG